MKKIFLSLIFTLIAFTSFALGSDFIVGTWKVELVSYGEVTEVQTWEFEKVNPNDGIINIYDEDGKLIDFWGWSWSGHETYHVKRYHGVREAFSTHRLQDGGLRMAPTTDVNNYFRLYRK